MKLPRRLPLFRINKYLLASVCFAVWMLFFDRNDVFVQRERANELKALQQNKIYFTNEIAAERTFSENLKKNPAAIEKFAREHYKMKRDGEELFLIIRPGLQETE